MKLFCVKRYVYAVYVFCVYAGETKEITEHTRVRND